MKDPNALRHISPSTTKCALKLSEAAKKISLEVSSLRFNSLKDYITFIFTNGSSCIILYAYPSGYLGELRSTKDDMVLKELFVVKSIAGLLKKMKADGYAEFDVFFRDLDAASSDMTKEEAKKLIDELLATDGEE